MKWLCFIKKKSIFVVCVVCVSIYSESRNKNMYPSVIIAATIRNPYPKEMKKAKEEKSL